MWLIVMSSEDGSNDSEVRKLRIVTVDGFYLFINVMAFGFHKARR
jgi:hypothetical protein